jgi:hypothetical protein
VQNSRRCAEPPSRCVPFCERALQNSTGELKPEKFLQKRFTFEETIVSLQRKKITKMDKRFEVKILDDALEFLQGLERKHYEKVLYNIRKSQVENDPELFNKLKDDIWEFRTLYQGLKYRLLAF